MGTPPWKGGELREREGENGMKKISLILFVFFVLALNFVFGYETVKATKIATDPDNYKDKSVMIYVKFDKIKYEDRENRVGYFEDFNIKGISYQYDLTDTDMVKKIKQLKQRDLITVKGKVVLNGFDPVVVLDDCVSGWVDTNLLPATPDEIEIVCPKCGETFKYRINKNDYKKSVISQRTKDLTPVVEQRNEPEKPKSLTDMKPTEVRDRFSQDRTDLERTNKSTQEQSKKDSNSNGWSF
jgi:hypothetical protein